MPKRKKVTVDVPSTVAVPNVKSRLETSSNALDLFSVAPTESPDVESIRDVVHFPLNTLDENNNIIEFYMQPSSLEYVMLNGIRLRVVLSVVKAADGTAITADEAKDVGLTELGLYGLFLDLKFAINGTIVDNTNNLYIHQNQVYVLTMKNRQEFDNALRLAGVIMDTPGQQDSTDKSVNKSLEARQTEIGASRDITWTGPLRTPVCQQSRLLPTGASLRVILTRAPREHVLTVSAAAKANLYKYVLKKCELVVPKVRLSHEANLAVQQVMIKEPVTYKIERFASSYVTIADGITTTVLDAIHQGVAPLCTFVTLTDAERFQYDISKSTTKYADFGLKFLKVVLEEEKDVKDGLHMTEDDKASQPVNSLYEGLGVTAHPATRSMLINTENFDQGYQVYFFNHTNGKELRNDAYHALKRGNIRMTAELAAQSKAVIVVYHMMFVNEIQIMGDRRVIHDY